MSSPSPSSSSSSHTFPLKHPKSRPLVGGDLLAQCLHHLGLDPLFGLHGGHLDSFLLGCLDAHLTLIDVRHETTAVRAAEGYAKVAGGPPGCCFVTAGSGFSNALPGLATALADRSPVLCITSSPPLREAETNALQGSVDQVVVARPLTKWAHRVSCVEEIPRLVSLAVRTASAGAPGPVVLDFPIDVLFMPVGDVEGIAWGGIMGPRVRAPGPDAEGVREVVRMLGEAERPVVVVGTGARDAVSEICTLAEKTGLPIFHSPKYSTEIPPSNPFHAGSATTLALLSAQQKPQPDLILLLGARTGFLLGGRSGTIIPPSSSSSSSSPRKLIQVDTDGSEIGRSEHVDLGLVSSVQHFVRALNAELDSPSPSTTPNLKRVHESWIRTALSLKLHRSPQNEAQPKIDPRTGHLHPYHALKKLYHYIPDGSILCIDGGEAGGWALQLLPEARASLSMVCTGYLGFLGNGWGYALGAAVAEKRRRRRRQRPRHSGEAAGGQGRLVVNIQGDGSAGFHVAELETFQKFGLRVLTVVVNNCAWGMSLAGQELLYPAPSPPLSPPSVSSSATASAAAASAAGVAQAQPHRPASKLPSTTRFDVLAQGFALPGLLIDATNTLPQSALDVRRKSYMELGPRDEERSEKVLNGLGSAVDEVRHSGGSGVIDLRVSRGPVQDATRGMVGDTAEKEGVVVVPYYDNVKRR